MSNQAFLKKPLSMLHDELKSESRLHRVLGPVQLSSLGIGAIIGTGIFVLTGTAAANQAGPSIMVSYLAAGLACGFAALCYAEFASMIPIAGSAYTYAYATLGELVAWMIGWDLILEYAVGSMTVAIGWSGYMQKLLSGAGIRLPVWMSAAPGTLDASGVSIGALINLPAVLIVLAITALLVVGVQATARANAIMVSIKLVAIVFFIAVGATYVKPENWEPFFAYGWQGTMAAAAVVFFAYIGFDAVSTTAEEAKNPQRDLPIGILSSLVVCTVLYLAVAAVLTGIVPVVNSKTDAAFLNAPVAFALSLIGQDWAAYLVSAGAVAGITSVLLVMLLSQPRIFFAMSRDRLLPPGVSVVHPKYGTPYITTIITGVVVAVVAGFTQIQTVGEMTSIGTLFAFVVVCAAVLILRRTRPEAKRPFRVPGGNVLPVLGIVSCFYLMLSLPVITWVRFLVWLDLGLIIYWVYGRTHSTLANAAERAKRTGMQALANFTTAFGALAIFNGFAMTILGFFTEWGITNDTTAKWHEIGVTAEQADDFGLQVLGVSIAVFIIGRVLSKASGEK